MILSEKKCVIIWGFSCDLAAGSCWLGWQSPATLRSCGRWLAVGVPTCRGRRSPRPRDVDPCVRVTTTAQRGGLELEKARGVDLDAGLRFAILFPEGS